jgi:hypothetical protein
MRDPRARAAPDRVSAWRARWRLAVVGTILSVSSALRLVAQSVRGTVTVAGTSQTVPGAVITATTPTGEVVARTLANQRGQYTVVIPSSATQLRVLRIGFRPRVVPLPMSRDASSPLDVSLALLETMLDVFEVRENSSCTPRRDRAAAFALFEQVRHGLLATIVARDAVPATLTVLRFQRFMVERTARIRSQDVTVDSISSQTRPFVAVRSASEFVEKGFVRDSAGDLLFFAPDAESLLDESFRVGYCFRLAPPERTRRGQVGLAFSVARPKPGTVNIDGAIWVDTTTRALTAIEYRYTGLDARRQAFAPGGRVEFREMPNGAVLVDRWSLRLVALQTDSIRRAGLRPRLRTLYEMHETGGELAEARWADGTTWRAALGAVRLDARTSDGAPAAGTRVKLEHTPHEGRLDETGRATFVNLLPGPYTVLVLDTLLSRIDVTLDAHIPFEAARDSLHVASFVVPTPLDYARSRCAAEPVGGAIRRYDPEHRINESIPRLANRAVAFFVYVTTSDDTPVSNLEITEAIALNDRVPKWHATATGGKTDAGGRYFSCWNYHLGETVQVWVRAEGLEPQLVLLPLTERVRAIRLKVAARR